MGKLIDYSVRHPIPVLMAVLAVVLLGVASAMLLPVDFLPKISVRSVIVATEYEGISAAEIRDMVTVPVEDSLSSMKGLMRVSSVSREGLSIVTLELHWGTDVDLALVECREIIDVNFERLPSGCGKPVAMKDDASKTDTVTVAVKPFDGDLVYARYLADKEIKPRLQRLDGTGLVNVAGGERERIEILVSRERMEARGLTLKEVSDSLGASNFEYPAGTLREGDRELLVKTSGLFESLDDIASLPVAYNKGGLVKVSDIAEVRRGTRDRDSFFLYGGKPCVKIGIQKRQDASPVRLSKNVRTEVSRLREMYGAYYEFEILSDESETVTSSLRSLLLSALIGVIVTFSVIYYFFGSRFLALVNASVIPVCACFSLAVLKVTGRSLNVMSLSGIALGIGMVVDSSSVVVESTQRRLRAGAGRVRETVAEAARSVALSNVSSVITTVIVFVPVLFMKGLVAELFTDLSVSIVSAMSFASLLSLSFVPAVLSSFVSRVSVPARERKIVTACTGFYGRTIAKFVGRKAYALALMAGCLIAGIAAARIIGKEFLPSRSADSVSATIEFDPGTSVAFMESAATEALDRVSSRPFVKRAWVTGGIDGGDYAALSDPDAKREIVKVTVALRSGEIGQDDAKRLLAESLASGIAKVRVEDKADLLSQVAGSKSGLTIVIGPDQEAAMEAAILVAGGDTGAVYPREIEKDYSFVPNRVANSRFGVSAMYTASVASSALEGIESSPYYEKGIQIPVRVMLREEARDDISKIGDVGVKLQDGTMIPLRALGDIGTTENEKILYRYDRRDAKVVRGTVASGASAAGIETFDLQAGQIAELAGNAGFLLAVIVVLLYLAMAAQFESFSIPAILLLALPPSFSGALVALAIFGGSINANSVISLVILFGISVGNSILLYEACREAAEVTAKSVVESAIGKLRPILVTNITTIAALLPFAADFTGKSSQSALAIAVIGGILVSSVTVLYAVPSIFVRILPGRGHNTSGSDNGFP